MELYRTVTGQSHRSHQSEQSSAVQRTTTQISGKDPLAGHLNHLTEQQEAALVKFRSVLQERGLWKPGTSSQRPSHDDATLLRYLRARKFDVKGAVGQFSDTEHWLKDQRVEELYEHFDVDAYEKARLMYPQWTGRRDRRGIPLYVFVIKHLDSKNVHNYQKDAEKYKSTLPNHKSLSTPAKLLPLFALYHNLLHFVLPMVSSLDRPNPEVPVTNSTNIVDISGVGLAQFWNLKAHMQDASVLATAHYPETLDRIFIIGAPSFFPTVWGWVKRWFDPVTVSKIFILSKHEVKTRLEEFIDPNDFPKHYGGKLDWKFGDLPHMDEAATTAIERDGTPGWVKGPCLWLDHRRLVVGSVKGKLRRADEEIAPLKPVVYAADKTAEPVHPTPVAQGDIPAPQKDLPVPTAESQQEIQGVEKTNTDVAVPVTNGSIEKMHPTHPTVSYQSATPSNTDHDVPKPASEPQSPEISDTKATVAPPAAATDSSASQHVNVHTSLVHDLTTKKMQGESISIVPGGDEAAMPEMVVASDPTKGLAIETGKSTVNGTMKPPMERFVTAVEDFNTLKGQA